MLSTSCNKHPHEKAAALCRRCGQSWCSPCLVYSFGPKKPPFCMSCAMVAGGVKSTAAMPAMSRRQLKAQVRALKAAAKADAKAAKDAATRDEGPDAAAAAAMAPTDWGTPWWEDRQPTALAD